MHVELLYHTPDPERAIATAARLCYAPVGAAELMETMPEERVRSVLSTIMGSGHFSTLEHASYTFAVDGVSRALTHQLVRHRIASFNQQSQRYVKFTDGVATVKPESVAAERGGERGVRRGHRRRRRGVREAAGRGRAGRGRALPLAERGRDEDRHHHERARAAALLHACVAATAPSGRSATWRTACSSWRVPRRRSSSPTPVPPACAAPAPKGR